jgi:epoxyqueuosine reductase
MISAEQVREKARALGFDLCAIAAVRPAPHGGYFLDWIGEGKAGTMDWMADHAEKRIDPSALEPGTRSLVFVGLNYFRKAPARRGRIATYALGLDYHDLMRDRLNQFTAWLQEKEPGRHRGCVDTAPVLEKPLAHKAGLGWQGKSTMLIHPKLGTWFFIGEILSSAALEPDAPHPDHCGTCTRCIEACPTRAITAPYQLDARRCISYLTIENKGPIPEEFRRTIGDRLYGCDECLDVCPWNRWARESREAAFDPRPLPDLREMLAWDDATFRKTFRGTPIFRIKRNRWLRNVCTVLGNIGTNDDLPALRTAAGDPDPLIAGHAAWAMEEIARRTEKAAG